jgi:hypothetical protein
MRDGIGIHWISHPSGVWNAKFSSERGVTTELQWAVCRGNGHCLPATANLEYRNTQKTLAMGSLMHKKAKA